MKYMFMSSTGGNWHCRGEYDDREKAIKRLKDDADLARMIWDLRVEQEDGTVIARYIVEEDMRLPGCKWRATERNARFLWNKAGCPCGRDEEFWFQAEKELPDHNGILVMGEPRFEENL